MRNTEYCCGVFYGHLLQVELVLLSVETVYVGWTKEALDATDLDVDLGELVTTFGSFFKYEVRSRAQVKRSSTVSAFTIMMAAQREVCHARLPDKLDKNNLTRKDH